MCDENDGADHVRRCDGCGHPCNHDRGDPLVPHADLDDHARISLGSLSPVARQLRVGYDYARLASDDSFPPPLLLDYPCVFATLGNCPRDIDDFLRHYVVLWISSGSLFDFDFGGDLRCVESGNGDDAHALNGDDVFGYFLFRDVC